MSDLEAKRDALNARITEGHATLKYMQRGPEWRTLRAKISRWCRERDALTVRILDEKAKD